jgi:hypothetical protein
MMIKPQIIPFDTEASLEQWINQMMNRNPGWSFFQHFDENRVFPLLANVHYNSRIKSADVSFFKLQDIAQMLPTKALTNQSQVIQNINAPIKEKQSWKDYFKNFL